MVIVALIVSSKVEVAVITVSPADIAVTTPLLVTVATLSLLEVNLTELELPVGKTVTSISVVPPSPIEVEPAFKVKEVGVASSV